MWRVTASTAPAGRYGAQLCSRPARRYPRRFRKYPGDRAVQDGSRNRTTLSSTIARLAKEAGVPVPTVCKVLNGRPDVARATRGRVEQVLEQHRSRRGSTSRSSGSRLTDLVCHELDSAWAVEIMRGVERAA